MNLLSKDLNLDSYPHFTKKCICGVTIMPMVLDSVKCQILIL